MNCTRRDQITFSLGVIWAILLAGCAPQDGPRRVQLAREKAGESAPDIGEAANDGDASEKGCEIAYDTPEGWTPSAAQGVRRVALEVTNGNQEVEIGVLQLPGRVEALLPNVNRWRRQIRLGDITQHDLDKICRRLPFSGTEADYLELLAPEGTKPRLAMLVVLATRHGKSWLFQLTGDADLALREKHNFEAFVKSVRFSDANTSRHGN